MIYAPTIHTIVFFTLFLIAYLWLLLHFAVREKIDLYDLILLSLVAVIPSMFVYTPRVAVFLQQLIGVAFPFLILFGALFVFTFIMLYRIVVRINQLKRSNKVLIQEISLLRDQLYRVHQGPKSDADKHSAS